MITCQHEWVEHCQIKYRWEPLPEGEHWEDAHYPVPECRNGTETVKLWSRDHAVHGVLQSIDLGYPCLHGYRCNTDKDLIERNYPEYLDLFEQELFNLRQLAGQVGGKKAGEASAASLTPEERSEKSRKAAAAAYEAMTPGQRVERAKKAGKASAASVTREQKTKRSKKAAAATNAQKWADPDHPELGTLPAGPLALRQKSLGYPHGKENRVRIK